MTGSASDEEDELVRKLARLKATRPRFESLSVEAPGLVDPLSQSLLELVREALGRGDVASASEALEGLLDLVHAHHPQRAEVELFERTVRGLAAAKATRGDRAPTPAEVVDPALSAGYLLMAAQDGELTPDEAAALEERLGPADAALRVEWGWLERARGALGRVATYEPADDDPRWERLKAGVRDGLDRPAPPSEPPPPAPRVASGADEPPGRPRRAIRTSRVVGSLEVATLHLPAAEPFGDRVDVSAHPGGVDVVLLDPSGRGPDADAIGLAAQVGLQAALAAGAAPSAAIAATNRALHGATARHMFVAGTLVRWDEARGVAVLAGAAGEDAVVRRAGRGSRVEVERVKAPGVVLGAVREPPAFLPREVPLAPGDLLLLVSDGVTEQPGPDEATFCDAGWTRLVALVTKFGGLEAAAFAVTLEAELRAWWGGRAGPTDDVVVVVLRRRRDLVTSV